MNHVYRLCWNRSRAQWVPACEFARKLAPGSSRRRVIGHRAVMLSVLSMALGMTGLAHAGTTGGQVTAGVGRISQSGNTTTIQQSSQNLSLSWQSFNIAPNETVDFLQPGASSIAVNRILGGNGSTILGHLNANGQVWLINPNGIIFGQGAQVNVGGLVASTLDVNDSDLGSNTRTFSGNGKGNVVNEGSLIAADGGYIALLGNQVSNQGLVSARLGTVALGAGSAETLTFQGNQLLHLQVDQSTLNNLAENRQIIQADGGQVIMTAGAKDALLASLVNNTGVVRAQTVENHNGTITLLGGMAAGTVNVGGTLDASAPNGGNGGSIETSAANFTLASNALITTGAKVGQAGSWLIDPTDLDLQPGDDVALDAALNAGGNVTLTTDATNPPTTNPPGLGTPTAGTGAINVNTPISWSNTAGNLTLSAYAAINVNDAITGSGGLNLSSTTGAININAATRADAGVTMTTAAGAINVGAAVNSAATVAMHAVGGNLAIAAGGSITGGNGATLGTSANFSNAAGAGAVTATTGNWLIYSSNPTLDTTGGLTPGFIQYNAPFGTAALGTGNGFLYSLAPTITITGLTGNVAKAYDGTTAATLAPANVTTSGLVNGDTLNALALSGTYASSNAATGIGVTSAASPTSFGITTAGGLTAYGYQFASGTKSAAIGTINPLQLVGTIVGNPTKVYDGTTTATLNSSNYSFNFVSGQGATVSQPSSVVYGGVDAGPETITATLRPTNFTANTGTNFANYILPTSASGPGTITQAPLNILNLLGVDKVYDGTTTDALNTTNAALSGVIPVDSGNVTLDAAGATGNFASPNVGNNLAVTANLASFSLGGSAASNYMLIAPQGLTADITPKALTVLGVTASNKIYDGTNSATLGDLGAATLSGLVTGDTTVTLADGSAAGTFSQSDVGNGLAVTTTGFNLTGTGAGNYSISQPAFTANITPKPLTIAFDAANQPTKIYDGTNAATLTAANFNVSGFVNGQSATIAQSPGTYASQNAASSLGVTATLQPSDFALGSGTSLSNYSFPTTITGGIGSITPAPLTTALIGNPTKVFDGTTAATVPSTDLSVGGTIGGETIQINTGSYAGAYSSPNAGVQGVSTTLTAADLTFSNGALASNYLLPLTFSGLGTITQAQMGIIYANIVGATKTYDGTTGITLLPGNFVLTLAGSDSASVTDDIAGNFASKNAGQELVSATLAKNDITFTSGDPDNYMYPVFAQGVGTITPRMLNVALTGITKVYDGSASAQLNSANFNVATGVAGESFTVTPTAAFNYNTANVNASIVSGTLTGNNYTPAAGTLSSNYSFVTSVTGPGIITPAPLFITGVYGTNKVYDTTTSDTLNVAAAALDGLVDSDVGDVTLATSSTGTFASANAGTQGVTASGFTISGTQAANYNLTQPTGLSATIARKPITVTGVTAENKPYDATNAATLDAAAAALSGVFAQDAMNVDLSTIGTGVFNNVNAGNRLVNTSGFAINGTASGNYTLVQPGPLAATINRAQLTATITGAPTKAYDGSDSATLTAADYTLDGFVTGQGATVPQSATASYAFPNAGTGLEVNSTLVSSDFLANAGTNLANYILPTTGQGFNGVITPYILNLNGTRVYDALTDANGPLFGTLTGLNGDTLTVDGSGVTASKNVGTYTAAGTGATHFDLGTLGLVSAGNGAIASNYTLVGGTDIFKITQATLNVIDGMAQSKTYNGTTAAVISGAQVNGVLGTDTILLNNATVGVFNSKNVNATSVTTAATLGGTDAGNYKLVQETGLPATISPLAITLIATGANKVYDGTTTDGGLTVGLSPSTPLATGDTLTYTFGSAAFTDPNVNNGILINVANTAAHGAAVSAGDYTFNTSAVTTANITPRPIVLNSTRLYDGTTDADASLFTVNTGVAGQALTLTGTGVLNGKDVGTQAFNGLGTLALGSGTGGLASNYTLSPFTADTVTINPLIINLDGTRVYDGLTDANGADFGLITTGIGSESLTVGGTGTTGSKNVGTYTAAGTAPNTLTLGTLGLIGGAGTDASDYTLVGGTDTYHITPLAISVATTAPNKTYDGTDTATVTFTDTGVLAGDTINFSGGPSTFATPNAGNGITVTTDNIVASGADAGNYSFSNTSTTTADILPKLITLNSTRAYDGSTGADASLFTTGGTLAGVPGQTLTLTGSGVLDSKNAGLENFAGLGTLSLGGNNGSLASNYTLAPFTADTVNVTPLDITVSAAAQNKVYDGTTTATVALTGTGAIAGDDLSFTDTSANFVNPNVVGNEAVNVLGIAGSGADLSNYNILNTTATTTAMITPRPIVLQSTRVYDGLPDAAAGLFLTNGTLAGIPGQTLTLTGSGVLTTKNVGSQQPFQSLGTLALGNGSGTASNYTLSPISNDWVTITPLAINVTAIGSNKTYDGNTNAMVALTGNGLLPGDQLSFTDSSATFASPNAGNGIAIAVNGISGSGADLGNYTFNNTATTAANITPAILNLSGTRTYDGATDASANLFGNNGVLTGVNGETLTLGGTGVVSSKNVGTNRPFAPGGLAGFTLTGDGSALASNYTFLGGTDTLTITPALLQVVGTVGTNRVYNGLTGDALNGSTLSGLFGNDAVALGNDSSGTFDSKNVGNNKPITTAMTISGDDAGNYILVQPTGITANVTPLGIMVNATGRNKPFDGNRNAIVNLSSTGVLPGDAVGFNYLSALFSDPNVGNNKSIAVNGITDTGADAGNYVVLDPDTSTTANITNTTGNTAVTGAVAQAQSLLWPHAVATPYGTAPMDTVSDYNGNHKKNQDQTIPLEPNVDRSDFRPGIALKVIGGGVRLPTDAPL